MKEWEIKTERQQAEISHEDIIAILLKNRGLTTKNEVENFLHPPEPHELTPGDVGMDVSSFEHALIRIKKAITDNESIVVYADYDADGITAGAIMWEALHSLGAHVMPYIPHRVDEGYGLSTKGIDAVTQQYHPSLIITVDHGITAKEKVAYAKQLGIDVIVTDHHVKPQHLPDCPIVHTTKLSGAGISWFMAKELVAPKRDNELLALAAIGTIADLVPLVGPNRSIAKYGLVALNNTQRVGLEALLTEAGVMKGQLETYDVSHVLAPRLNAMGRLVHAMDALRLLCTKQKDKATLLAQKLGLTNKDRQQLTIETALHARSLYRSQTKLIFISSDSYNQGVIGLVAGKLVEEFYKPAIVVSKGEAVSKASARSIAGFNIVEAIRTCSDILVDVGGHPMAAGFTVETKNLPLLQARLEKLVEESLDEKKFTRSLFVDVEIPLSLATESLWQRLYDFKPFGLNNPEPVFVSRNARVENVRLIGINGKHLKMKIDGVDCIGFGMGSLHKTLQTGAHVDIAYVIDMNTWNGNRRLQLKLKDIHQKSPLSSGAPEP